MKILPEEIFKKLLAFRTYKYTKISKIVHPSFYLDSLIKSSNERDKLQEKSIKKRGRKAKKTTKKNKSEESSEESSSTKIGSSKLYKTNLEYYKSVIVQSRVGKSDQVVEEPAAKEKESMYCVTYPVIESKSFLEEEKVPKDSRHQKHHSILVRRSQDLETHDISYSKAFQENINENIFKNIDYLNVSHERLKEPVNKRVLKDIQKKNLDLKEKESKDILRSDIKPVNKTPLISHTSK